MERSRGALLGVEIGDPHPPLADGSWFNRLCSVASRGPAGGRSPTFARPATRRADVRRHGRRVVGLGRAAGAPRLRPRAARNTAEFGLFDVGAGARLLAAAIGRSASCSSRRGRRSRSGASTAAWRPDCSARPTATRWLRRSPASRRAGSPRSTPPRPSAAASSATCTTAPSSAWWRSPWTSAMAHDRFDGDPAGGRAAGRRGARGGQGGAGGAARPRAGHPPGDPRGPRPRRRAVGGGGPLPVPVDLRSTCGPGRRPPSRAPPTSWWPRRSPTSTRHAERHPGLGRHRPAAATAWSSRSTTTATAAPTAARGTGPAGLQRPGRRARRVDGRHQPARRADHSRGAPAPRAASSPGSRCGS